MVVAVADATAVGVIASTPAQIVVTRILLFDRWVIEHAPDCADADLDDRGGAASAHRANVRFRGRRTP
jgi:hypothetical protein